MEGWAFNNNNNKTSKQLSETVGCVLEKLKWVCAEACKSCPKRQKKIVFVCEHVGNKRKNSIYIMRRKEW